MRLKAKVKAIEGTGNLVGMASITIDESFVVSGIRIMTGKNGLFLSMPSRQNKQSGEWEDICFPITKEARKEIIDIVISAYENRQGDAYEEPEQRSDKNKKLKEEADEFPF